MSGKKQPTPKSTAKRNWFAKFLEALGDRYHRVLQVIDEALDSENLKDKIWAVDLILKRTPLPGEAANAKGGRKPSGPSAPAEDLSQLGEAELMARLREQLPGWEE